MRCVDLGSRNSARAVILGAGCLLLGAIAWVVFGGGQRQRVYIRDLTEAPANSDSPAVAASAGAELVSRAQTTTLWDELFPVAPAPEPEPPPPMLAVDLIAIIGVPAHLPGIARENGSETDGPAATTTERRAFIYDKATQTYQELAVGDALGSAHGAPARDTARLVSVGERFAVFTLAGRDIRVELAP